MKELSSCSGSFYHVAMRVLAKQAEPGAQRGYHYSQPAALPHS
jgi:hypothetical protein